MKQLYRTIVIASLVLWFSPKAVSVEFSKCVKLQMALGGKPGAFQVKDVLESKGLDAKLVNFVISKNDWGFNFDLYYEGRKIGSMASWRGDRTLEYERSLGTSEVYQSNQVAIEVDSFRGKGLGSLLYIVAASYIAKHTGRPLATTGAHSEDARSIWERLVSEGVAVKILDQESTEYYKSLGAPEKDALRHVFVTNNRTLEIYAEEVNQVFVNTLPPPNDLE